MNGLQGTLQPHGFLQLFEAHIGFYFQQANHLLAMLEQDHWFAPCQVMPGPDVPAVTALLEQLLDHPQGHSKAASNLIPRCIPLVISFQNSFPQIHGDRSSIAHRAFHNTMPLVWLYYLLICSRGSPGSNTIPALAKAAAKNFISACWRRFFLEWDFSILNPESGRNRNQCYRGCILAPWPM